MQSCIRVILNFDPRLQSHRVFVLNLSVYFEETQEATDKVVKIFRENFTRK